MLVYLYTGCKCVSVSGVKCLPCLSNGAKYPDTSGNVFHLTFIAADAGCGGSFTSSTGTLQSPGYPGNYSNNLNCAWNITIPDGTVGLKFSDFSVEGGSSCPYDYLQVKSCYELFNFSSYARGLKVWSVCVVPVQALLTIIDCWMVQLLIVVQ